MGPLIANLRYSFIALFVVVSVREWEGGGVSKKRRWGHWYFVGGGEEWFMVWVVPDSRITSWIPLSLFRVRFVNQGQVAPVTKSAIVLIKFHFAEFMKREAIFEVWVEHQAVTFLSEYVACVLIKWLPSPLIRRSVKGRVRFNFLNVEIVSHYTIFFRIIQAISSIYKSLFPP